MCKTSTSCNPPVDLEWLVNGGDEIFPGEKGAENGQNNANISTNKLRITAKKNYNGAVLTCRIKSLQNISTSIKLSVACKFNILFWISITFNNTCLVIHCLPFQLNFLKIYIRIDYIAKE